MKTFLCVAEKPSVAKTATQILSKGEFQREMTSDKYIRNNFFQCTYQNELVNVIFTSVKGHLFKLSFNDDMNKWNAVDPYNLFSCGVTWKPHNLPIHSNLSKLSKKSDFLMLWLDNDLEGEKISEEVEQVCLNSNSNLIVKRCRFSALSESDLFQAFNNPSDINRADSLAVNLRIETDLRAGSAFTRFQTLQLRKKIEMVKHKRLYGQNGIISYGTCQFPTLGFIVEAYNERKNFVPEPYWFIDVVIEKDKTFSELKWSKEKLFCRLSCFAIYASILSNPIGRVVDIEIKTKIKKKPLPLTTVVLQKKASKYFKIDPTETMVIAERLYSKGFISYTRTETDSYPQNFNFSAIIQKLKEATDLSISEYATNFVFDEPIHGSHTDNAHPPIYPIKIPENVTENEFKIFEFISRYFLATISKDAVGEETKVYFDIGDEIFTLKGLRIVETNFLDIYPYSPWNGKTIPYFEKDEIINIKSLKMLEGQTPAPSFISEHHLLKRMDNEGIGTDSTMADIIKRITDRNFTYKKNGLYIPTEIGLALVNGYKQMGFDFDKPNLRADLEKTMQKISKNPDIFDDEKNRIIKLYENAYIKASENISILEDSIDEQMKLNEKTKPKSKYSFRRKRYGFKRFRRYMRKQ